MTWSKQTAERIRRKLALLTQLAPTQAEINQPWSLAPPVEGRFVQNWEELASCALPVEYRNFILNIGDGNRGQQVNTLRSIRDITPYAEFSQPFPLHGPFVGISELDREVIAQNWKTEVRDTYDYFDAIETGYFVIADYGCAVHAALILNGPFTGDVWCMEPDTAMFVPFSYAVDIHGAEPLLSKDAARFSFLDWYEHWLDNSTPTPSAG